MSSLSDTLHSYLGIYKRSAIHAWEYLTPQQYASILITVAVVGFIAMRSKPR